METRCVFSCFSHFVDDKLPTGGTKSSHQMWRLHAATKLPPPSLAFMSPVKPSAAICGHYPGDQTETQTDSTCSEAVRQGFAKRCPLWSLPIKQTRLWWEDPPASRQGSQIREYYFYCTVFAGKTQGAIHSQVSCSERCSYIATIKKHVANWSYRDRCWKTWRKIQLSLISWAFLMACWAFLMCLLHHDTAVRKSKHCSLKGNWMFLWTCPDLTFQL